jgi:hypothetical protein
LAPSKTPRQNRLPRAGRPEFTRKQGHHAGKAPAPDNLLVFYPPEKAEWEAAVAWLQKSGYEPVASFNPYWNERGKTFEDPDGNRVVLQNASWPVVGPKTPE